MGTMQAFSIEGEGAPLQPLTLRGPARRAAGLQLGDRIAEQAYHLDAAMHRILVDIRAFDAAGYWADEGAVSCAAWLSWRVGWTPGTGREHVRVARALGTLPRIDAALRDGRLSYSKVRAITRVATPATEEALLIDALATTASQLEIICRKLGTVHALMKLDPDDVRARRMVTRRERRDGMVVIEAVLPADEAAIVFAAIEHAAARLANDAEDEAPSVATPAVAPPDVSAGTSAAGACAGPVTDALRVSAGTSVPRLDRADGLVAMSQAALRGDAPGRAPVEVVLTISKDALAARPADQAQHSHTDSVPASGPAAMLDVGCFEDGTCVSAETARRLACDCGVVELHEDAAGEPLSVGRRTRSIPAAIARALARRDATCRFPGCTNRRFLDGHHLTHWINGGETALANLCRLCSSHHRFVHEHGYRVERLDGELAFLDRRGRRVSAEPPRVVRAPLGWPAILAANANVDLDATTGASGWDGHAVQYEWVIDELVRQEYGRDGSAA